jgi:hypothetical protein
LPEVPSFSITLPSAPSSSLTYYIAFFAPGMSAWVEPALGPATVSGDTLTFAGVNQSVTLTGGDSYYFALYSVASSCQPNPSPSPSSSPGTQGPQWTFGGSSAQLAVAQGTTPPAGTLSAYNGVGAQVQFAAPISGSGSFTLQDAMNGIGGVNDTSPIAPNTTPLPADNATSGYSPIVYLSILNAGTQNIDFGSNIPKVTLTDNSLARYATCELDVYGNNGNQSSASWFSVAQAGSTGTPTSSGVVIGAGTLPAGAGNVTFQAGSQQIVAVSCGGSIP